MKTINLEHNEHIKIKIKDHSFIVTAYDFEKIIKIKIEGRGKNSLNMKIKPCLENEIDIEVEKQHK